MRTILAVILTFMLASASAQAALFDLEITNIKPATEGTPAIPASNRIFRAYPGIEYNIRAAVIGGKYPYTHSLSNAPAGMTINSATGEISWTPPVETTSGTVFGPITLSVTDSDSPVDTESTTWSITVTDSTSDFIFVQSGYSGTETGSISEPYSSLANFLTATYNNGSEGKIVYFKSGTYQMVQHNDGDPHGMAMDDNPRTWLAFPGDTVTLQGGSGTGQADRIVAFDSSLYIDGLTIKDTLDYGIITQSSVQYKTVRRCKFTGLEPTDGVNRNYGLIYFSRGGSKGYGTVVQDNEFSDWTGAAAIGSIYHEDKMLIENNRIHSPRATSTYSGISTTIGIGAKEDNDYMTIRGNAILMNKGHLVGGLNSPYAGSDFNEICFNLLADTTYGSVGTLFDQETEEQGETYYWRNTTVSRLGIAGNSGPYTINNNIIINNGSPMRWDHVVIDHISYGPNVNRTTNVILADNLTGSNAALVVDSSDDYKLLNPADIGTYGWQLPGGSTPMEGTYVPPDPDPINGVCGSANGGTFSSTPATNLCNPGTASDVTLAGSTYSWTCAGLNGGDTSGTCTATYEAPPPSGNGMKISAGSMRFGAGSMRIGAVE